MGPAMDMAIVRGLFRNCIDRVGTAGEQCHLPRGVENETRQGKCCRRVTTAKSTCCPRCPMRGPPERALRLRSRYGVEGREADFDVDLLEERRHLHDPLRGPGAGDPDHRG